MDSRPHPRDERLIIGCMTGTSIDGIDAALVSVEGHGTDMRPNSRACVSLQLGDLAPRLRTLAEQRPMPAKDIATLMHDFALLHIEACSEVMRQGAARQVDLICVHGQTVYHKPPVSWQLMQPAPIVRAFRCPVVFDLRAADLAAGGQGAPLTPIADAILFGGGAGTTAVVNLGGFANATCISSPIAGARGIVQAADICPCNNLLDAIARKLLRKPFDEGGAAALSGHVHPEALEDLDGILSSLRGRERSLGTGDECEDWISRYRSHLPPADLAATACEAIADMIAAAVRGADRAYLAGGGVRHIALRRAIEAACSCKVELTDARRIPASHREAIEWAILGALCQDRVAISLSGVTNCCTPEPIAGAWVYP